MRRNIPFVRRNKEYESNLAHIRMVKGYTVRELSEKCQSRSCEIHGLQNGTLSPICLHGAHRGSLRPTVIKLCELLSVSAGELFPRYICDIARADFLSEEQIEELTLSEFTAACLPRKEENNQLSEIIEKVFSTLKPKEKRVLELRFGLNGREYTLAEAGNELGITRERVRQVEAKALRKLRHPSRSRKLKPFWRNDSLYAWRRAA